MITIPVADKAETEAELDIVASETAIALLNNNREGYLLLDNILDWPDSPSNTHEALDSLKQELLLVETLPFTPENVLEWSPTPASVPEALEQLNSDKASKEAEIVSDDAEVSIAPEAAIQTGLYVQADVQSIADLANDLKAKYDALVVLTNELKSTLNAMNI